MNRVAILLLALFSMIGLFAPRTAPAQAGIHRCVDAKGGSIYTDQLCSDLQATDRPTQDNMVREGNREVIARTCARKPDELLSDVRNALAAQDVNRFAGSYLWTGMGSRAAYSLMDRLNAYSNRPLIDAQLVSGAPPADPYASPSDPSDPVATQSDPYAPLPDHYSTQSEPGFAMPDDDPDRLDPQDPDYVPPDEAPMPAVATAPPAPRLIRIEQTRSAKDSETATSYLRIVPAAGCLWVSF